MKTKFNFTLGFVLAIAFLLSASIVRADHSWGNYHWARTSNPFTVKLGDNVRGAWGEYLQQASADWSASSVLDTTIVEGGTQAKRCAITGGQVEVCNSRYGDTGWFGVAGLSVSGEHITGAYVKLNDSYSMTDATKDYVMCQEIGHTLGLDHQDIDFYNPPLGTCMDYSSTATVGANTQPNPHDYDQLVTIYSHLDSTTTLGAFVPPPMALADYRSPRAWGKAIRFNKQGQPILFERDFGNGNKVFTHIYPVPGSRLADEDRQP